MTNTLTTSGSIGPSASYPKSITIGDATVTVHADGRIEGDAKAWAHALAVHQCYPFGDQTPYFVAWLLLRELQRQEAQAVN